MDPPQPHDMNLDNDDTENPAPLEGNRESVLLIPDVLPEEILFDTIENVDAYVTDYMKRAKNGIVIYRSAMKPSAKMFRL